MTRDSPALTSYAGYAARLQQVLQKADWRPVEALGREFQRCWETKRQVFLCGNGGSAGNASHAVNDFRKICGIEAYTPVDNVSELTARVNDDGWESVFSRWLEVSRLAKDDLVFVLSVGGGELR